MKVNVQSPSQESRGRNEWMLPTSLGNFALGVWGLGHPSTTKFRYTEPSPCGPNPICAAWHLRKKSEIATLRRPRPRHPAMIRVFVSNEL